MIGIAGAHRTGKSTLARKFSAMTGTYFLEMSTSGTFARLGLDPKKDYPLRERVLIQQEIIQDYAKQYEAAPRWFVTDRTPIDTAAYLLADTRRENVDAITNILIEQYLKVCIDLADEHFKGFLVLQPGIPLVEEVGKAPAISSYVEHINQLIIGLTLTRFGGDKPHVIMHPDNTDMGLRLKVLSHIANVCAPQASDIPASQYIHT